MNTRRDLLRGLAGTVGSDPARKSEGTGLGLGLARRG